MEHEGGAGRRLGPALILGQVGSHEPKGVAGVNPSFGQAGSDRRLSIQRSHSGGDVVALLEELGDAVAGDEARSTADEDDLGSHGDRSLGRTGAAVRSRGRPPTRLRMRGAAPRHIQSLG